MKKYVFAVLITLVGYSAFSQVKIGLKLSPNFSWSQIVPNNDTLGGNGLKLRGGAGIVVDFLLSDNFAFSTGVDYTTKGSGFKFTSTDAAGAVTELKSSLALQYIEIPISIKVFTNEIMDYTKMYFQVGVTQNINIGAKVNGEKIDSDGENYTKNIKFFEASLLVGVGIEMEMGESTVFFTGLSYNRGLTNIDKTGAFSSPNKLANGYLAINVGLKF